MEDKEAVLFILGIIFVTVVLAVVKISIEGDKKQEPEQQNRIVSIKT